MKNSIQAQLDDEKEKNRVLSGILNAIPEVIVAKDSAGKIIFVNGFAAERYNTTPDKMIGTAETDLAESCEKKLFYKESPQAIISRLELGDNKTPDTNRYFYSLKIPFKNSHNQSNVVVIDRDITEIIKIKNLAESKAKRLAYVLDASKEGVWDWNVQTKKVTQNRRWKEITGVHNSEKTFEDFLNCVVDEDQEFVSTSLRALIKHNTPYDIEFRFKRPDGRVIWIWDRGTVAEFDDQGKPLLLVGIMQEVTQQKLDQSKIESMAFYDTLSKLPNRALLDVRLNLAINKCKQTGLCGAVLFLDLDNFKTINDSYGHQAGDELLIVVADRLKSLIGEHDTVARFGGDEFVIILNELSSDREITSRKAEGIAHAVRNLIGQNIKVKPTNVCSDIDHLITASVGIAIFDSGIETASELLKLADLALYQAKNNGRDGCALFDPTIQQAFDYVTNLEKKLRHSLTQDHFVLHYQPQYDAQQKIVSAEALIRWNHPELGLVSPGEFITVAEMSNLIMPIGYWVLVEACEQLKQWQSDPLFAHLKLSINISAKQILQKDFVESLKRIVTSSGINCSSLVLEITESVLVGDIDEVVQKLDFLVDIGLTFSLDDFGTGYSSLGYLKNLPIKELKIDQSFIRDLLEDESDLIMVKSIIDLGNNFNLTVVAEGVEKESQFDLLKTFGCDLYQGYYFSKPVPIVKFESLIHENSTRLLN